MKSSSCAPLPSIRRFPLYHRIVVQAHDEGLEWISASQIGDRLGLKPIQIRKDMAFLGIEGSPKKGYLTRELIRLLADFLGWNNNSEAFLVGAGALGAALLGYEHFAQYGLNIVAAFDTAPHKIGTTIHRKPVMDIKKLPELAKRMGIKIAILTVPASAAQDTADMLVEAGIKGIWDFSPRKINVSQDVIVQREDLAAGLAILTVKMRSATLDH